MIGTLIGPIITFLDDCVRRAFPDKTEADRISAAMQMAVLQADMSALIAQLEVNKTEAASNSIFVAGWRPAVGWVCASAYGYAYVIEPFLRFACAAVGHPVILPSLDIGSMSPVLLGMLGLAGMRSYEKVAGNGTNGKANGH